MRTCLAVSSHLAARHVDEERIRKSDWLFIEGYVFANPDTGQTAIREAIRIAKLNGTKIAITCSDAFVVHVFGDALREALNHADLFFCNESEACAVSGSSTAEDASRCHSPPEISGSVSQFSLTALAECHTRSKNLSC
jgi:sugar/nucleoside kinase (ribokinase family)